MTAEEQARFVAEVLRINDRYTHEVVEAFNLCPYARGARNAGRTAREVLLQTNADPEPTLALMGRLEQSATMPDVVQVIYPRLAVTPREFERFNSAVRDARAARNATPPAYAHATFHPGYRRDERTPDALVYFFRRTPDPTIQLVRFGALDSVRGERAQGTVMMDIERFLRGEPVPPPPMGITERITRDNHALVLSEGPERLEALFAQISADRDRAYAPYLGLPLE